MLSLEGVQQSCQFALQVSPFLFWYMSNVLLSCYECSRHLIAAFQRTVWVAPLTVFVNFCLLLLAWLHLEHTPGKLPDLSAVRPVVISCASALLCPTCMVQLSVLCHTQARAMISTIDSPAITPVRFPNRHQQPDIQCFHCYSFHHVCLSSCISVFSGLSVSCLYRLWVPSGLCKWT